MAVALTNSWSYRRQIKVSVLRVVRVNLQCGWEGSASASTVAV